MKNEMSLLSFPRRRESRLFSGSPIKSRMTFCFAVAIAIQFLIQLQCVWVVEGRNLRELALAEKT